MRTIPFVAKFGAFYTTIRFNANGECFQPPGVTMPDGEYQLMTAARRSFGSFTVMNGQVSRDIHNEVGDHLLRNVRGAILLADAGASIADEFMTAAEQLDRTLADLETAIDMITGQPARHHERYQDFIKKGITRDGLLEFVGGAIAESVKNGVVGRLLGMLADPTPEVLARSGRTDVAHLEHHLVRLRALQAWQPTESVSA